MHMLTVSQHEFLGTRWPGHHQCAAEAEDGCTLPHLLAVDASTVLEVVPTQPVRRFSKRAPNIPPSIPQPKLSLPQKAEPSAPWHVQTGSRMVASKVTRVPE